MDKVLIGTFRRYAHSFAARSQNAQQVHPLTGFYKLLLDTPFHPANPLPPGVPHPPATTPLTEPFSLNDPTTTADANTRVEKARVVFGSRLAGPGRREEEKRRKGTIIAGVRIPPKPTEPDNCCMSGCVNCTWDIFREDLEEWRAAMNEARAKQRLQDAAQGLSSSMDDDGGPPAGGLWEGYDDIPVGMKAFMETEKRLKEKHKTMGSTPG